MLTVRKLDIYEKYGGDIDHLFRVGSKEDQLAVTGEEWGLTSSLLQDMRLIGDQLASKKYEANVIAKIKGLSADKDVISRLCKLADKRK